MTARATTRQALRKLLPPPPALKMGPHPDPEATPAPDRSTWPRVRREAFDSPEMARFRECLRHGSLDERASVVDDLSTHYGLPPEECVQRAVNWEAWSVEEWSAADRSTPEGLLAFYRSTQSWGFDVLWYAYCQAMGQGVPLSVLAAHLTARHASLGGRHLDFGSGAGVTSQLFGRLGFETDLADIATGLLGFARFRLERRGEQAAYLDLNETQLPDGRYDVITALDTLAHVPDLAETCARLHRSLRPGGVLVANFGVREPSPENAWHLYSDDLQMRRVVHQAGFEPLNRPLADSDHLVVYRAVARDTRAEAVRSARDRLLLTNPLRTQLRRSRRQAGALVRERLVRQRPASPER